jgi:ankyrin repeat protein
MFQHLLIVQFLVKHGANLEAQNIADDRPLHLASLSGKLATVQFLVDSGES